MISPELIQRALITLPFLNLADTKILSELQNSAFYAKIPAGKDVFIEGDEVQAIALLISGIVRVYKIGETGREITLYRFGFGESCILTANAILHQQAFPAIATVEQDAEAIMIPSLPFQQWVKTYDVWRNFVFDLLSQRIVSMMVIIDEVAFRRMDARVASLLLTRAGMQNPITITHQEIASELGSSREVISRILEDFGVNKWIDMQRGEIKIRDFNSLQKRSLV